MTIADEAQAKAYWTAQMDAAYTFMQHALAFPVDDCGEGFVYLPDAAAEAGVEVTFSDTQVVEGIDRLYYLRQGLIADFIAIARDMNQRGWILKVEDGFRTVEIQKNLARKPSVFDAVLSSVLWECNEKTPDPIFMAKRVAALIAYCPKVGTHMSGTAIDISVFDRGTDKELDRGGPYLEMSALSPMASPFVSGEAKRNRQAITAVMESHGFIHYPQEFWHYNKNDAYTGVLGRGSNPAKYGPVNWNRETNQVTPIADPTEPLNSPEEIQASIEASLKRLGV